MGKTFLPDPIQFLKNSFWEIKIPDHMTPRRLKFFILGCLQKSGLQGLELSYPFGAMLLFQVAVCWYKFYGRSYIVNEA